MNEPHDNPVFPPKMRELYGYNAAIADEELSFATARCIDALDRRHRLQERVRFGTLALNSATLLALMTITANDSKNLTLIGLDAGTVVGAIALFILGTMLSGLAIWTSTNHYIEVTGSAAEHVYAARHKKALFEMTADNEADLKIKAALDLPARELWDYKFSKLDIILFNASGIMWLVGTGMLLLDLASDLNFKLCG
jgi:hypothetical protein